MYVEEFIKTYRKPNGITPEVVCADGFSMSVQASLGHYCAARLSKRENDFSSFSCGYPNEYVPELENYKTDRDAKWEDTDFSYVPHDIVQNILDAHGGIALSKAQKKWRKELAEKTWANRRALRKFGYIVFNHLRGSFFSSGDVYLNGDITRRVVPEDPNVVKISLGGMPAMPVLHMKSRIDELYEMEAACSRILNHLVKFRDRGNYEEDNETSRREAVEAAIREYLKPLPNSKLKWSARSIDGVCIRATRGPDVVWFNKRANGLITFDVLDAKGLDFRVDNHEIFTLREDQIFMSMVRKFLHRDYK